MRGFKLGLPVGQVEKLGDEAEFFEIAGILFFRLCVGGDDIVQLLRSVAEMIRENFSKHGSEIGFPIEISSVFCAEHVSVFPVGAVAIVNAPLAGSLK